MHYSLKYLKDLPLYQHTQPYELYGYPSSTSPPQTNLEYDFVDTEVTDMRNSTANCTLDTCGFMVTKHQSSLPLRSQHFENSENGNAVVEAYIEEIRKLTEGLINNSRVLVMDWRFRRNAPENFDVKPLRSRARPIGSTMHCDYSFDGGEDRLKVHLFPEELEGVNSGRLRPMILNVWRPIRAVENAPLLLCDKRSVRKSDLIEVDKVLPDKVEKAFYLPFREAQKWYMLSGQQPDEVFIFQTWTRDSGSDSSDCPPHGAPIENVGNTKARESIEVRMIVLQPTV